jgi:ribulose-5-phosphate 4-epimerase/fuculose-1-phosphate aldolase
MPTNTVTENSLRRDLAAAYQLATRRGWDHTLWMHITAALAQAQRLGDDHTPKAKTDGPSDGVNGKRRRNLLFQQENFHAHHPCRIV